MNRAKTAVKKLEVLEEMARSLVGDGGHPNLFFVSEEGRIQTITLDFEAAYDHWKNIAIQPCVESALEDRHNGTICSVEQDPDAPNRWQVADDSHWIMKRRRG